MFKTKQNKHNPSPETVKKQNEWRRNKYRTDQEHRPNRIEQAKEYHQTKIEELGIEKQPKGRPRKYQTKEEANQANLEKVKESITKGKRPQIRLEGHYYHWEIRLTK